MADSKFEEIKKEIRSLLISYQKGVSLSEFRKEYRSFIGRKIPFEEFKFKDDVSLLKAMPDVVAMTPVRGDLHLFGIADKSVQHIQNMVCKQKPAKRKTSYRMPRTTPSSYAKPHLRAYELPPRFSKKEIPKGVDKYVTQMLEDYPNGIQITNFLNTFSNCYRRNFVFKDWGFYTLEECLERIPGIVKRTKDNEIRILLLKYDTPKRTSPAALLPTPKSGNKADTKAISSISTSSKTFLLNKFIEDSYQSQHSQNSVSTEKQYSNGKFIEDSYQSQHSQNSVSTQKQYSTDNPTSAPDRHNIASNDKSKGDALEDFKLTDFGDQFESNCSVPKNLKSELIKRDLDELDSFPINRCKETTVTVSENIKRNLRKVIGNYNLGIFAVDFKNYYEKVTKAEFDLHSLGFNCLADLIDAVPDILIRKPLTGSKKDWVIYSADALEDINVNEAVSGKCSVLFIESVILNTRKILQAYAEGIKLNEFTKMYSFNCNEPLYIRDLGFDDIEYFLLSIAKRVPLKIDSQRGYKIVLLDQFEETIKPPVPPLQMTDIAEPEAGFKDFRFPRDFDFSKYFPIYTSSIANPGLLYIQLQGENTSDALKILYDEIESFYKGELGDVYKMKPKDIRVNAVCVALWPEDRHWYRAKITCIKSMDFVQVFYVDYGTTDEIPISMLRYIKKSYLNLPAQAVKARLAFLKPPNNASSWEKKSRRRMLELCEDVSLMAKIEGMMYNIPSLILCNTNGDEDLFINDILTSEGIAEVCGEVEEPQQSSSPILQTQAFQQFVNCLASVSQTSPDAITRMVQNLSMNFANTSVASGFMQPPVIMQPITPLVPLQSGTSPCSYNPPAYFQSSSTPLVNPPLQQNVYHNYPPGFAKDLSQSSGLGPCKNIPSNKFPSPEETSISDESEIFGDDDDEYFEQMYQKLMSSNNVKECFVKRVKTTDNYIFHILLYSSKPFVSGGDISNLIWNSESPFKLFSRLQSQEVELPSITLYEDGYEEFFLQLERFSVKGIQKSTDNKSSILMYPLAKINQILNLFGHPSAALRVKADTELSTFNPSSAHWQASLDNEMPGEIEEVKSVTDDDKLNRLCLYDLKTMKEGIRSKRLMLIKKENPNYEDEIIKLNQLFTKVRERIVEIEQICKMFSDRS